MTTDTPCTNPRAAKQPMFCAESPSSIYLHTEYTVSNYSAHYVLNLFYRFSLLICTRSSIRLLETRLRFNGGPRSIAKLQAHPMLLGAFLSPCSLVGLGNDGRSGTPGGGRQLNNKSGNSADSRLGRGAALWSRLMEPRRARLATKWCN